MTHHLISSPTQNTNKEQLFLFLFSIIFPMQLKQIFTLRALSSFIHSLMDSSSSTHHFFSFFIFIFIFIFIILFIHPWQTLATCQNKCGSLPIKYPLGTGYGCGSPRFYPFITCQENPDPNQNQLHLTTHLGSYPITSLSYTTSTLTITPPLMSTCTSIQSSPNFGLDWSSPFQLGPSLFILLHCPSPTSSLTFSNGQNPNNPLCDSSYTHLCASIHTCPSILSLGLPIFAPTNTCCVYSPANLNSKGDLDLQGLKCATYVSVVSLGDIPTDPNRWEYGVVLKYNPIGLDNYDVATNCDACEKSDGVCGYEPPRNNFVCVCKNGLNNSMDCMGQDHQPQVLPYWSSGFKTGCGFEFGFFYGSTRLMVLLLFYCLFLIL